MAKNTTKPTDEKESSSMLARVSNWFKPKKKQTDEGKAEQSPQTSANKPSAQSSEGKTGPQPRRRSRRPPRKRSSGSRKPAEDKDAIAPQKEAMIAEAATPKPKAKRRSRPPRRKAADREAAVDADGIAAEETDKVEASYKLLINTDEPEECRIVLLESGKIESFHVETVSRAQTKGNIYKGIVTAVEPNLQAAFVDYGTGKNGFLSFSDIHPEYYNREVDPDTSWKKLNIQDVVSKGQEMLIEVVKEATGNKGASITTYLSLPGRYLVLMPGSDSAGISRKIESESERSKLRKMVDAITIPEGIGYIIRTASRDITKTAISQDICFLLNLWEEIKKKGQTAKAPALLHKEQNIISRFLRDSYTTEINEILVDDEEALAQVKNFLELLPATQKRVTNVKMHKGTQPLFHQFHVEKQIEQIFQPTVSLPSGGSIVISPTEALVAIDVNSGSTGKDKNFEETIFLANMEAAEELSRQLKLRDLGGLIVVDFIDMRDAKHVRAVEKKVRDCMKRDKAKVDFSRISKFGLMQISRQKMAAPVQMGSYNICPHCKGRGMVRSVETQALVHLRHIHTGVIREHVKKVSCRLPAEVAEYLLSKKHEDLMELEQQHQAKIIIESDPTMTPTEGKIEFLKG
ncbi:MAG: Rne/Rng family ribonuclease [Desulfobulbaceae bacterium]|nr:Rne/Rng family ribonuclease [Desulfobulbaceae bacterium]HIJ78652.1 Rne/Rng family ribonuclease [Deltaproteobacteria bacterium]